MADEGGTEHHDGIVVQKASNEDTSDVDGETFEDARDLSAPAGTRRSASASSRSLIEPRPASSSEPADEDLVEHTDEGPPSSKTANTDRMSGADTGPMQEIRLDGASDSESLPPKSPPLTSRRISTASLDEVSLEEVVADNASTRSRSSTIRSTSSSRVTPHSSKDLPPLSTGSIRRPSMPWAAANQAPSQSQAPPPRHLAAPAPPPLRKLSSPFSWLTRGSSTPVVKESPSPPLPAVANQVSQPQHDRRNTSSSLGTTASNPELMLSKIGDGQDSDGFGHEGPMRPGRNSLRDRFKMLRIKGEAGITSLGDDEHSSPGAGGAIASLIGRGTGLGLGIGGSVTLADEDESGSAKEGSKRSASASEPSNGTLKSDVNPQLAPGTAAGMSAGPSAMHDPAAPVDWDLWQSVVYEGPAAVARTSPGELNRAIASGIPSAIRGVVWQVLAQSKNEELEGVYKDLISRGTDQDKDRTSASSNATSNAKGDAATAQANGKESITSSDSSTHSGRSTPATSAANGISSPTTSHKDDLETIAKLQAHLLAEKRKKAGEDAVALQKLERAIKRDLGARTSYSKYAASAGLQDGLFGVCKAYALFDEGVGYAQGMNFLIMPLLFNMPEEEAFCLLVRLMNHYHIRDMFIKDMPGLHLHLYQFERLLEDLEPALYCHLNRRGVTPQLYATQWFLTLFAYRFPLQLVLRIYDLVLSEGLEGAILKFGIVLMQKNAEALMGMSDMVTLTTFLKERLFDVYIDQAPSATSILESGFFGSSGGSDKEVYRADIMVQDACAVNITSDMLKTYTAEWEEKARQDREREAEMEAFRATNAGLSVKIRSLEDSAEKFDTEHVHVASELVRTKVENEELRDENESLKGQVEELRKVVKAQPEEVEAQLKEEMDRIMKRNMEVQNENRGLEEQMTDMEKDLVTVKMQYAEVRRSCATSDDYRTLTNDAADQLGARDPEAEVERS
ncbi:MAG: GTPase-activating protein [Thelocarpon impressellum]|nr:MAG: GTPase-activating protein [Thelocarpon impressellum]